MIERLRVRIPAGAVGEFSSPELTLCADSHLMSIPPPVLTQWYVKDPGHSAKKCRWQVTPKDTYTHDPLKSEWANYAAVQAECGNL